MEMQTHMQHFVHLCVGKHIYLHLHYIIPKFTDLKSPKYGCQANQITLLMH